MSRQMPNNDDKNLPARIDGADSFTKQAEIVIIMMIDRHVKCQVGSALLFQTYFLGLNLVEYGFNKCYVRRSQNWNAIMWIHFKVL